MINIQRKIQKTIPKVGRTIFISIDGHGGSGKSTLAKWLSEKLDAELIHIDDFAGLDNPPNWWSNVIEHVFAPIAKGATFLSYQPASWSENHHPEAIENQPVTSIMILEGVSSSRREFDAYISLRIFVATPKDICLERGIKRDAETGKSKEELMKMWQGWFAEEDIYMQRDNPKEKADILISGTIPFADQIDV